MTHLTGTENLDFTDCVEIDDNLYGELADELPSMSRAVAFRTSLVH